MLAEIHRRPSRERIREDIALTPTGNHVVAKFTVGIGRINLWLRAGTEVTGEVRMVSSTLYLCLATEESTAGYRHQL